MARLLNALFGRAYSYDDLLKESAPFLNNPKLPEGLPEAMARLDGKTRTFLEFTQLNYKEFLKDIASKPSKDDQKKQLVFRLLSERSWHAVERAAKDAKHIDTWAHLASGSEWFEPYPKAEWRRLLVARGVEKVRADWAMVCTAHNCSSLLYLSPLSSDKPSPKCFGRVPSCHPGAGQAQTSAAQSRFPLGF